MHTPPLTTLGVIYYIVVAIDVLCLVGFFVGIIIPAWKDLDD